MSSDTHIRSQRLREIERDDLSRFAHPSYARMFAMDYAKYLGIPISRIRRLLPDAGECGTEGYQYLQEAACDYIRTNIRPFRRRKRVARRVMAVALLLLFSVGSLKVWTTIRDIERLGLNRVFVASNDYRSQVTARARGCHDRFHERLMRNDDARPCLHHPSRSSRAAEPARNRSRSTLVYFGLSAI